MENNVNFEAENASAVNGNQPNKTENPMGFAPLLPLIAKMSLPSIFSMLIQALYNIVDSMYVAQLSETALSAVSLVFPVQLLITAVSVGTGVGLSSFISRKLGEKRLDLAESGISHGILFCNLEYLVFLLFGIFGSRLFATAFTDDPNLVNPVTTYCTIISIGSIFIFNALAGERCMQACGNMIFPMYCQLIGSITNIILDPIMIFGKFGCPALGVAGAAYATIIGQLFSMIATYIFLYKGNFPIRINFKGFKYNAKTVKDIYAVALPAMVMQAISSVTTVLMNKILIGFSDTAVAVLGAYFKLQSFVFMPIFGLNQGILPIMGYNFGARKKDRLIQTLKISLIIAASIMVVGKLVFQFMPEALLGIFDASENMLKIGIPALQITSWCFIPAAFGIIPGAMFQATGHGTYTMINSILRQIVVIMPSAIILSKYIGETGVWVSYILAEGISLVYTWTMVRRLYRREIVNL